MGIYEILQEEDVDLIALQKRSRWDGILTKDELQKCIKAGITVAYDCCQHGWIIYDEDEEFGESASAPIESLNTSNLGKHDFAMILEEFNQEMTRLQKPLDSWCDGFGVINGILQRSKFKNHIKARNQLHCFLVSKLYALLKTETPKMPEVSVDYRRWEASDVGVFQKIMGNKNVWQHLPEEYPEEFTTDLAKSLIEIANIGDGVSTQAIVLDGEIVGQVRLLVNDDYKDLRAAEVVYMLGEEYWGRGLMSQILVDFVTKTFAKGSTDIIYAWIKPENEASIRCAERAGFIKDDFGDEASLAKISHREGFSRYLCYRNEK